MCLCIAGFVSPRAGCYYHCWYVFMVCRVYFLQGRVLLSVLICVYVLQGLFPPGQDVTISVDMCLCVAGFVSSRAGCYHQCWYVFMYYRVCFLQGRVLLSVLICVYVLQGLFPPGQGVTISVNMCLCITGFVSSRAGCYHQCWYVFMYYRVCFLQGRVLLSVLICVYGLQGLFPPGQGVTISVNMCLCITGFVSSRAGCYYQCWYVSMCCRVCFLQGRVLPSVLICVYVLQGLFPPGQGVTISVDMCLCIAGFVSSRAGCYYRRWLHDKDGRRGRRQGQGR